MAAEQLEISDAIIDLTSIPEAGKNLKITVNSDADSVNRFGLVKLQEDSDGSFMVGGLKDADGESFDDIVWEKSRPPRRQHNHCNRRKSGVNTTGSFLLKMQAFMPLC